MDDSKTSLASNKLESLSVAITRVEGCEMSSFLSKRVDTVDLPDDATLARRIKDLSAILENQDKVVLDGCQVLESASLSLAQVRTKFEPVKEHAASLSATSKHCSKVVEDLTQLSMSQKVHIKLDKATAQAGEASKLDELLDALDETMQSNDFLLKFDQLDSAVKTLTANRISTAHAAKACAGIFDRILKQNTTIPSATALQAVLDKPAAARPKAEDVFFKGKSREIKTLTSILALMGKCGEQACLQAYIASRQQAVTTMLQLIATTVNVAVPTAAHAERRIYEWGNEMRMLAQILEWEDRLSRNILPPDTLATSLHAILSSPVDATVQAGMTLASGRVQRDQIFPLLDMIACMHDPYVLPSMKKAFRSQTMSELKKKFLGLLTQLCDACKSCLDAYSASVGNDVGAPVRDPAAMTTVAAQTAFAMRVLKNVFRKDVQGKLPFLTEPRKFASNTIADLFSTLESKATALLKDPAGVNIAMLNNLHYVLAGVTEHDHLPDVLGKAWRSAQQSRLRKTEAAYFAETWAPLVASAEALAKEAGGEVRKEPAKETIKKMNLRIEKTLAAQAPWSIPDTAFRESVLKNVAEGVVPAYTEFWSKLSDLNLFKTPAKYFKYDPEDLDSMIRAHLFSGAPLKPGVLKK